MKLSKPALHPGVSFAEYLGDLCPGPSVSASTLIDLENRCPAHAWARYYLHPSPVEREDTDATEFGIAAHCYILEGPVAFGERYVVKPAGMNFATKEGKAWREAHARWKIIPAADFSTIYAMGEAVMDHPAAGRAFAGGHPEITAVCQDEETGLWLKTRPDLWRPGDGLALNYKTAMNAKREPWERQAWSIGYHMSAALCVDVLRQCGIVNPLYGFVVQEKEPPYTPVVRVFDDAVIEWGRIQYRAALRKFAACLHSGKWPGYSDTVEKVGLPPWAEHGLEKRHEAGDFSPPPFNPEHAAA